MHQAIEARKERLMDMDLSELQIKWMKFKELRKKKPTNININDPDFLSVTERETIIDILFDLWTNPND